MMELINRTIRFYRASGQYGFLSNLFKRSLKFEDRIFPASEYAYLFGKFKDEEAREWAMKAPKPHLISILAHGLFSWDIVDNWSKKKIDRMYKVLQAKFLDEELKEKLLETGDAVLIEESKTDAFWGIGKKGTGKNMLGKLLMKIRNELKCEPLEPLECQIPKKRWCGCGDEILIDGDVCEVCKFMEDENIERRKYDDN